MSSETEEEKKMKFIYNAIEQGFSVKKLDDKNYEFILKERILQKKAEKGDRRSVSTPITKKEIVQKIFIPKKE